MALIGPHPENAVHKIAFGNEERNRRSNDPQLLIPHEVPVFEEDDPRVQVARASQLDEVHYVLGHQDTVLSVCAVQHVVVRRLEETPLAHVDGIQAILSAQHLANFWRDVLIEQQLDVHAGGPSAGRPS